MRRLYADLSPGIGWTGREPEALEAATASQLTERTVTTFLEAGTEALAASPRPIAFLVGGATPAHAPATATATYIDENDVEQVEVVSLLIPTARSRGAVCTEGSVKEIVSVVFPEGSGTGATIAIGFGLLPTVGDLRVIGIELWLEAFPDRTRPGLVDRVRVNEFVRGASSKVDGAIGTPNGNYTVPLTLSQLGDAGRITRDFAIADAGTLKPAILQVDHVAMRRSAEADLKALRTAIAGIGNAPPDPAANVGGAVGAIGECPPFVPPKSFTDSLGDYA